MSCNAIGAQRRSILNHAELAAGLKAEFGDDFASVSLEGTSVSFQCLLFSSARVVIAQHGEGGVSRGGVVCGCCCWRDELLAV